MRYAAQQKMGYYKTPLEVVERIKKHVWIEEGARLVDTCCGEGEALALISAGKDVESYGVELDPERARKASQVLDHVLNCDALYEFRASHESFGLLWLNPPYDLEQGDEFQSKQRLELLFLKRHFPLLQLEGVLVYIIPFHTLAKAAGFLSGRLTDLKVYSFPSTEFQAFKQIVVLGKKRKPTSRDVIQNRKFLKEISKLPAESVPQLLPIVGEENTTYPVPSAPGGKVLFKSTRLDPDEAYHIIRKDGLYENLLTIITPREPTQIRPLTSLRQGHLAMLLASGLMNGDVEKDGRRYTIKGSVRKVTTTTFEGEEGEKEVETDRYEIVIKALDWQNRAFVEIR